LATPDPSSAAEAWLARLPPAELAAAQTATDWNLLAWAATLAALVVICAIVARLGLAGRIRRLVERDRPRPWLASAAVAAMLAIVVGTAKALLDAVAASRADALLAEGGGGLWADFLQHLREGMASVPLWAALAALLAPPLLALMRRRSRAWPIAVAPTLTLAVVSSVWAPYALSVGRNARRFKA
jgi:STE24 endopeptidase